MLLFATEKTYHGKVVNFKLKNAVGAFCFHNMVDHCLAGSGYV